MAENIGPEPRETDMDRTFTRRFTTALSGSTLAVGVLASTLVVESPAAADTMGISVAAAAPTSPANLITINI